MGLEDFSTVTNAFREGAKVRISKEDGSMSAELTLNGPLRVNTDLIIHSITVGVIQEVFDTVGRKQQFSMKVRTHEGEVYDCEVVEPAPEIQEEAVQKKKPWWQW